MSKIGSKFYSKGEASNSLSFIYSLHLTHPKLVRRQLPTSGSRRKKKDSINYKLAHKHICRGGDAFNVTMQDERFLHIPRSNEMLFKKFLLVKDGF